MELVFDKSPEGQDGITAGDVLQNENEALARNTPINATEHDINESTGDEKQEVMDFGNLGAPSNQENAVTTDEVLGVEEEIEELGKFLRNSGFSGNAGNEQNCQF